MKRVNSITIVLMAVFFLYAENEKIIISEIITNIDNYRNKTLTVNLKLKYIDRIFEKIIFYDSENVDVEFDISGKIKRKALSADLLNIHEGMLYSVKFTVIGTGTLGGLTGDLIEFTPLIFDKIPETTE
jgi:hypothetical protein